MEPATPPSAEISCKKESGEMEPATPPLAEISCKKESAVVNADPSPAVEPNSSERATVKLEGEAGDSDAGKLPDPSAACSKRQLKRLKKIEDRRKMRAEWKSQRKSRNKARKTRNKLMLSLQKTKITPMSDSARKFAVAIDFSYDDLMSAKDLIKCANQVVRCYSANRRSSNPMQLHFCNFSGKIETELAKNDGYKKWDIHFHESNYLDVFDKSNLVYLTSESRNVLDSLEEGKVYIIGGLVDHNAHKGVSYRKAVHEGISHAQLPIKKHIQMKSRSVLTINHVFEILLKVANGESWPKALQCAVPARYVEPTTTSDNGQSESTRTSDVENQNCDMEMENSAEEKKPDIVKESPSDT